jgi:hypothetical protein
MFALISPNESVLTGYRVVEVSNTKFEIALPLFWVECNENIRPDFFYFNTETQSIISIPVKDITLINTSEVIGNEPNVIA